MYHLLKWISSHLEIVQWVPMIASGINVVSILKVALRFSERHACKFCLISIKSPKLTAVSLAAKNLARVSRFGCFSTDFLLLLYFSDTFILLHWHGRNIFFYTCSIWKRSEVSFLFRICTNSIFILSCRFFSQFFSLLIIIIN